MEPARIGLLFLLIPLAAGCGSPSVRAPMPAAQVCYQEREAPAPPGDRYYVVVFGSQSTPKVPRYTHTWVTAVRVSCLRPGGSPELKAETISWMPVTLRLRPWHFCVEPGVNLELHHTMKEVLASGQCVAAWGPYEIQAGLYRKLLLQKALLESGQVGYQAVDVVGEAGGCGNGTNCIHAVTGADDPFARADNPVWRYGQAASECIVRQWANQGAVVAPDRTHAWLITALGLQAYPIEWRSR
jgi:hypothetical protein